MHTQDCMLHLQCSERVKWRYCLSCLEEWRWSWQQLWWVLTQQGCCRMTLCILQEAIAGKPSHKLLAAGSE